MAAAQISREPIKRGLGEATALLLAECGKSALPFEWYINGPATGGRGPFDASLRPKTQ